MRNNDEKVTMKDVYDVEKADAKSSAIAGIIAITFILVIILGLAIFMLDVAIDGIFYATGKPLNYSFSWTIFKICVVIFIPLFIFLIINIKNYITLKKGNDLEKRPMSLICLFLAYIFIGLGGLPFIAGFYKSNITGSWIMFGFGGAIGLFVLLCGLFYYLPKEIFQKKLLDEKIETYPAQAKYLGCKVASSSNTEVSNVPVYTRTTYYVKYEYTDQYGNYHQYTTPNVYTYTEVAYLKNLGSFKILMHKNYSVIVEDLANIDLSKIEIPAPVNPMFNAVEVPNNLKVDNNILDNDPNINKEQLKSNKSLCVENQDSILNQLSEDNKTTKQLPFFAKSRNYFKSMLLDSIGGFMFLIVGIFLVLKIPSQIIGYFALLIAIGFLIRNIAFYIPKMICEKKGKLTTAKLINLDYRRRTINENAKVKLYAILNVNNETKRVRLIHSEWYNYLKVFLGKNIPVKVYRKTIVIDFNKIYSSNI